MPAEPMAALLVSDQAEEVKLITVSLRGFYPGCRLEAVYSQEEALEWASREEWHVVLLDERLPPRGGLDMLPELKRRAPGAAVIVLSDRTDATQSAQALRGGAGHFVFKKSPGFLTELMVLVREVLEKRDLRIQMDLTQSRYFRLVEVVTDLVYELDKEGRFLFISQNVLPLLGYGPQELIGAHYSTLLQPDDRRHAERRLNERRTGARATRNVPFRLVPKRGLPTAADFIEVEISAKGLYDRRNQFLGTIGIARDLSAEQRAQESIRQLEEQARQAESLTALRDLVSGLANDLSTPLSEILNHSADLLQQIRDLRLEDRLGQMVAQASQAAKLRKELSASIKEVKPLRRQVSINNLLEEALDLGSTDLADAEIRVERRLDPGLALVQNDTDRLREILTFLLSKQVHMLRQTVPPRTLHVATKPWIRNGHAGIELVISDGGDEAPGTRADLGPIADDRDWSTVSLLLKDQGGVLEVAPSTLGGIVLSVWLQASEEVVQPTTPSTRETTQTRMPIVEADRPLMLAETPEGGETLSEPSSPGKLAPADTITASPRAERRRSVRTEVQIEATLRHEGNSWSGTVVNVSLGGLYMVFEGLIPVGAMQSLQLGLVSPAAVLQLQGLARSIREVDRRQLGAKVFPAVGVAVEFEGLTHDEGLVLVSLLDAIRQRSVTVTLAVLLHPTESEEMLVGARAENLERAGRVPLESFPPEGEELTATERRFTARANFAMPARVDVLDSSRPGESYEGRTVNLSPGGACVHLPVQGDLLGRRVTLSLSIPEGLPSQAVQPKPDASTYRLTAEVAWVSPEPPGIGQAVAVQPASMRRLGLRFLHIDERAEGELRGLVITLLASPLRIEELGSASTVVSTLMECRNQRGHRLAVSYDRPRNPLPPGSPLAVLAPGFGETKKEYLYLAYTLATNGFHVLRYDHTDHVGESQGEMTASTLSGMKRDLSTLIGFAGNTWPASPIVLIAPGLAGRVALRAISDQPRVHLLVLLSPTVDIGATLRAVHQEDMIALHRDKPFAGVVNILGFNIDGERWFGDVLREDYCDLESTLSDAARGNTPVILFTADQDPRISSVSIKHLQTTLGERLRQTYLLPTPSYRLHEDPRADRTVYRRLVRDCLEHCYPIPPREGILEPSLREIRRQRLIEQERLQSQTGRATPLTLSPWEEAPSIPDRSAGSSDHWRFLDDIYRLMGRLDKGERVLDVACAGSQLGMALLINRVYWFMNRSEKGARPPLYICTDPRPGRIARTRESLTTFAADLMTSLSPGSKADGLLRASFATCDGSRPLPFATNSFERVICNLAIAAARDPLFSIREFTRVLAPKGRLIVTSLIPNSDLTQLYRNLVNATGEGERVQTKGFLNKLGELAEGERNGSLRFFEKPELVSLLTSAGAVRPRVYDCLGNLVMIAVGEKPDP